MKFLYIANERRAAQAAGQALRGIAPQIALSWAQSLRAALRWVHDNRDAAAVIVEADVQRQGCASFVEHVRRLGLNTPVVVVAPQQADLAQLVAAALQGVRTAARDARICTALQETLFELESALRKAREAHEAALAEHADAQAGFEEQLIEAAVAAEHAQADRTSEAAAAAAREEALSGRLDRESAMRATLERNLAESRRDSARARRRIVERASGLRRRSREHKARLEAQLARERAEAVRQLEARDQENHRLRASLDTLKQAAADHASERARLETVVRQVPSLQKQLEESQTEARQQFEKAPYPLCRCAGDGTITEVNQSLLRLLGHRSADDLQGVDFAFVFECADDLRWLIERSVSAAAMEPVETTWKTADRRRLHVRLQARIITNGCVEIAGEDITSLREVEHRLSRAHRMEAVGRLASEVAVTCDALLRDVSHGGRQWLAAITTDTALRNQGELLLDDVTRAAGFLRQFAVYGDKQIHALEPVNVQTVLRHLGPVLKRVAGDDIQLVLPKANGPVEVDVDAERVERILINVASYARERMPHGGRIKVDLTTTVLDRRFIDNHPNVRAGAHVLLTVTEVRGGLRPVLPAGLRLNAVATEASQSTSDAPGMDLGALLGLIGDCGGHLWMAAEPSGNLTLKIYLPKCEDEAATTAEAPAPSSRGRQLARWFRH